MFADTISVYFACGAGLGFLEWIQACPFDTVTAPHDLTENEN